MTDTMLSLHQYACLALGAMSGQVDRHVAIIPFSGGEIQPLIVSAIDELPPPDLLNALVEIDRVLVMVFLPPGQSIGEHHEEIASCLLLGRSLGAQWDIVVSWGGVRFAVRSGNEWIDEPETDALTNADLDEYMVLFSASPSSGRLRKLTSGVISAALGTWRHNLEVSLSGCGTLAPLKYDVLRAGHVRDSIIVWAVGGPGLETYVPGQGFHPPESGPDERRIDVALRLLADGVGRDGGGHALGCAAYLAWWAGWNRLALYCIGRAESGNVLTRLGSLVRNAILQEVAPPWMR